MYPKTDFPEIKLVVLFVKSANIDLQIFLIVDAARDQPSAVRRGICDVTTGADARFVVDKNFGANVLL